VLPFVGNEVTCPKDQFILYFITSCLSSVPDRSTRLHIKPSLRPISNFSSHRYPLLDGCCNRPRGTPRPFARSRKYLGPPQRPQPTSPHRLAALLKFYPDFSSRLPNLGNSGCWLQRPVSRTRAHGQALCSFRFPLVRMSRRAPSPRTAFHYPNPPAGPLYCLCPSPDAAPLIRDIHRALSSSMPQRPFPRC
jgi:hypothetical protein